MKIYEGTVDRYARLYPLLREEPRFLFEYGQCLAKTGRYGESSRILKEAVSLSGDPMFYNILGKNEQALGRPAEAARYFLRAARSVQSDVSLVSAGLPVLGYRSGPTDPGGDFAIAAKGTQGDV